MRLVVQMFFGTPGMKQDDPSDKLYAWGFAFTKIMEKAFAGVSDCEFLCGSPPGGVGTRWDENDKKYWRVYYERIANDIRDGDKYLFFGTGDGCIPAYHFAAYFSRHMKKNILGCILHNGYPAITEDKKLPVSFPTLMLVGKKSVNRTNLYRVASRWRASVLSFDGGYTDFPSPKACSLAFSSVYLASS